MHVTKLCINYFIILQCSQLHTVNFEYHKIHTVYSILYLGLASQKHFKTEVTQKVKTFACRKDQRTVIKMHPLDTLNLKMRWQSIQ